ncbi:reverse transcriptase domain-containing protein [Tanacetum coccineum]
MSIQLANRSIKYPIGVCKNLLVKLSKFIFPVDFLVLEMDKDELVLIILGRPFLATVRAVIDVREGKLSLRAEEEEEEDSNKVHAVSFYPGTEPIEPLEWKAQENKLKPSSVEPPKLELKELPEHLEYAFLQENNQLPVVISCALSTAEKARLLKMLKHLVGHEYYCFLDGLSGYFQIPIAPEDQEKTIFTCPYGTFAYKLLPFGLCNAPTTIQRCRTAIFYELIEDCMEVFMDDYSVFGMRRHKSFDNVTTDHLEDIMASSLLLERSSKSDSIGLIYFVMHINELDEMRLDAYESSISYKERTKRWHDKRIKAPTNYERGNKGGEKRDEKKEGRKKRKKRREKNNMGKRRKRRKEEDKGKRGIIAERKEKKQGGKRERKKEKKEGKKKPCA